MLLVLPLDISSTSMRFNFKTKFQQQDFQKETALEKSLKKKILTDRSTDVPSPLLL